MLNVYLHIPLHQEDLRILKRDFPQVRFFTQEHFQDSIDPQSLWQQVEVLYGEQLNQRELESAYNLRWIHLPSQDTSHLCLQKLRDESKVLITTTRAVYAQQITQWILACYFAFAKSLFTLHTLEDNSGYEPVRQNLFMCQNTRWLHIGKTPEASTILSTAQALGCQTFALNTTGSFQPGAKKVFPVEDLPSIISHMNVITCIHRKNTPFPLTESLLLRIKKNTIILLILDKTPLPVDTLTLLVKQQHLRGLAIDTKDVQLLHQLHPLVGQPNFLKTKSLATFPHLKEDRGMATFKHNLRQFMFGNLEYMHNILAPDSTSSL